MAHKLSESLTRRKIRRDLMKRIGFTYPLAPHRLIRTVAARMELRAELDHDTAGENGSCQKCGQIHRPVSQYGGVNV